MSLDDLLPLLLVAAFVLNAVLRRRRSSGQGRGTPRKRAGTPEGSEKPASTSPSAPSSTSASTSASSTSSAPSPSSADDLAGRLEEARRRVRQASGAGQQGPGQPSVGQQTAGQQTASRPSAGSTGAGRASAPPPPGFLGREGMPRPPSPTPPPPAGFLGREGAPAARVTKRRPQGDVGRRTGRPGSATLPDALGLVGLRPDDVVRGLVWSEVLGRPAGARLRRRKVSPRRSR